MALSATTRTANDLTSSLERASRGLRAAVIAADHAGAKVAVSNYVEALWQVWAALPEQERAVSALPGSVRELLSWAREMTIIQRSLMADQLRILEKASRYEGAVNLRGGLQVRG